MHLSSISLFSIFAVLLSATANRPCRESFCPLQRQLFDWVEENGGFIHSALELSSGNDPSWTIRGIFATQDIKRGEVLAALPDTVLMCSTPPHNDMCGLVDTLAEEISKAADSRYWPYISYLEDHVVNFPAVWSDVELTLLDGLQPTDWTRHIDWYKDACAGDMSNEIHFRAMLLVVARANLVEERTCLSPLYDSFNHGNFYVLNTEVALLDSKLTIIATADIHAGEQVYNNFGEENVGRLFRDYGFLSQSPRFWEVQAADGATFHFWEIEGNDGSRSIDFRDGEFANLQMDHMSSMYQAVDEQLQYLLNNEPQGFTFAFLSNMMDSERMQLAREFRDKRIAALAAVRLVLEEKLNSFFAAQDF